MVKTNFTYLASIALNSQSGDVPEWIQLIPTGDTVRGVDGRVWSMSDVPKLIEAFNRPQASQLPIDIEHSTQIKGARGEAAPAVGWIVELEARNAGLWGRVDWNETGRELIAGRAYRYISPVFKFAKQTGEITRMVSAALTNNPNLDLVALNSAGPEEENEMDKAVLGALGLNAASTAADAVVAIEKLKQAEATALNAANAPDPDKFVPKADHELALNRVKEFEEADKGRADEAINAAVDAAVLAGKIAPASKDYHIASCRAEGGLARFNKMVGAAPVIAGDSKLDGKEVTATNTTKLTAEDIAACQALGMTEEDFAKAKSEE
ncbi:phage protease [Profundibacter sp.]